ncbi:MAG: hypothetical protein Q9185_000438 [Variospora sp. 1 TL-2023]
MKEALLDPPTWAFAFYALAGDIPNGGIADFSQLIMSFGYTLEESLLYGMPRGATEVVALIICGYFGDRYSNRLLISSTPKQEEGCVSRRPDYFKLEWLDLTDKYVQELLVLNDG